ncbi:MAG TPA: CCA tRNA nucleotidyltransferase [Stellaceae bacterium]
MSGQPVDRITPFPWMRDEQVVRAMTALGADAARFVGGAVRDALLGRAVAEIDIATRLTPDAVIERLGKAGIATVPTGIAHGTVTAIMPGRTLEITTLRRDLETDGRHARVVLIDDWDEDARRRDFTVNALYLDTNGNLYDPVGGREDLRVGRIRFIGNPEARLAEDGLRLLRFYRFFAHYGKGEADRDARAACRKAAPLMNQLSAERIQAELLKLLRAPNPVPALQNMAADGVLTVILPEAMRLDRLARLVAIEPEPDPVRRLAAAVSVDKAGATALAKRRRLANDVRARLEGLAAPAWPIDLSGGEKRQRRALYHLGRAAYRDLMLLSGDASRAPRLIAQADKLIVPVFPLKGGDVAQLGVTPGPKIGAWLAAIEAWWEEDDFGPNRDACLAELKKRLAAEA